MYVPGCPGQLAVATHLEIGKLAGETRLSRPERGRRGVAAAAGVCDETPFPSATRRRLGLDCCSAMNAELQNRNAGQRRMPTRPIE